jgi:hypothetical protein
MFLEDSGRAVLIDFGLVRDARRTQLTRTGQVLGTMAYMAPECLRGEPATLASDWYGWGSSYYACLEGRLPYTTQELLAHVTAGAALTLHFEHTPEVARAALLELMDPDPEGRPSEPSPALWNLEGSSALSAPRDARGADATTVPRQSPEEPVPEATLPPTSKGAPKPPPSRALPVTIFVGALLLLAWIASESSTPGERPSSADAGSPRVGPAEQRLALDRWALLSREDVLAAFAPKSRRRHGFFLDPRIQPWRTTEARLEDVHADLVAELSGPSEQRNLWARDRSHLGSILPEVEERETRVRILRLLFQLEYFQVLLEAGGAATPARAIQASELRQQLLPITASPRTGREALAAEHLTLGPVDVDRRRGRTIQLFVPGQNVEGDPDLEVELLLEYSRPDVFTVPILVFDDLVVPILGRAMADGSELHWRARVPPWVFRYALPRRVQLQLADTRSVRWLHAEQPEGAREARRPTEVRILHASCRVGPTFATSLVR